MVIRRALGSVVALFLLVLIVSGLRPYSRPEAAQNPGYTAALWLGDTHGIAKISAADGSLLLRINGLEHCRAMAWDEWSQRLWVFTKGDLQAYRSDGSAMFQVPVEKGCDKDCVLVSDPVDGASSGWVCTGHSTDSTLKGASRQSCDWQARCGRLSSTRCSRACGSQPGKTSGPMADWGRPLPFSIWEGTKRFKTSASTPFQTSSAWRLKTSSGDTAPTGSWFPERELATSSESRLTGRDASG